MPEMLSKIAEYMRQQNMPAPPHRVLVAVSGGPDSVALLLILRALGYEVAIAHCNHGLREASVEEECWVRDLATRLGLACHVRRFTAEDFAALAGEGVQQAARKLRYAFYEASMTELGIAQCATAHHADDQLETQVMSFFRGNGPQLLRSIPAQRGPYIRPLLGVTKAELIAWLIQQGQDWCHDSSNDQNDYQRNAVRNELLPLLGRLQPGFEERFARQAQRYAAQQAWLDTSFSAILPMFVGEEGGAIVLDLGACRAHFGEAHVAVFLEWWLASLQFEGNQIAEITRLLESRTGAIVTLGTREVLHDRDRLRIRAAAASPDDTPIIIDSELAQQAELQFGGQCIYLSQVPIPITMDPAPGAQSHWMDLQKLQFPLCLRRWQEGDRIAPLGMRGSKLVSDILIDQKRDRFAKTQVWVLEDADGIVLVKGYRIAARVAISPTTLSCIRLDHAPSV